MAHHTKYVLTDGQWTDGQRTDRWTDGKHVASAHIVGRGIKNNRGYFIRNINVSVRDSH